jgi:hypothetical protein
MIIPITSLWLPILVGAILVFVMSSIIHMFLPYHRNDFGKVPDEDRVMDALRPFDISPGDYVLPHASGPDAMKSEEFRQKVEKGPLAVVTILPPHTFGNMGPTLVQWFAFTLLVGIVAAYVAGRTLAPGAEYLSVFRLTGTVAFASYSMALMQRSIWYKASWNATLKSMFDGLVYAAVTAGAFGWLWPA